MGRAGTEVAEALSQLHKAIEEGAVASAEPERGHAVEALRKVEETAAKVLGIAQENSDKIIQQFERVANELVHADQRASRQPEAEAQGTTKAGVGGDAFRSGSSTPPAY